MENNSDYRTIDYQNYSKVSTLWKTNDTYYPLSFFISQTEHKEDKTTYKFIPIFFFL